MSKHPKTHVAAHGKPVGESAAQESSPNTHKEQSVMSPPKNISPYGISAQPQTAVTGLMAVSPPQIVTSPSSFPLTTDMVHGQTPQPMNPSN